MKILKTIGTRLEPVRPNAAGFFPRLMDNVYQVALGNGTQYTVSIHRNPLGSDELAPTLFVGIMGHGFYQFTHYAHAVYVREKFKISLSDASLFANFINDQLPNNDPRLGQVFERQGVNFIQSDLSREWFQADYPVAVTKTALVKNDDADDAALVSVVVTTEFGAEQIADMVTEDALKLAVWGMEKLFNETVVPPPKMLGSVIVAGTDRSSSVAHAIKSLEERHSERVRAAL